MGEEQTEDWVGLLFSGEIPIPGALRQSLAMAGALRCARHGACAVSRKARAPLQRSLRACPGPQNPGARWQPAWLSEGAPGQ